MASDQETLTAEDAEDAEEKQPEIKGGVTVRGPALSTFTAIDYQPMKGFNMRMFFALPFLCVLRVLCGERFQKGAQTKVA